ncbi:MAG: hypothetical protein KA155_09565 [Alphaproteobacteria bacterium]|jgi:hypothetical protein|nr:hypothetical protein [Alphaproteobacteria bacterium]
MGASLVAMMVAGSGCALDGPNDGQGKPKPDLRPDTTEIIQPPSVT